MKIFTTGILVIIVVIFFIGCKTQSNEEKIDITTSKIISSIRLGNYSEFKSLIGVELLQIGKNDEMLNDDFIQCKKYFDLYVNSKNPAIIKAGKYTSLGQRKVIIPFYEGADTLNNISRVTLELFFGPSQFVPFNKISDYELTVSRFKIIPAKMQVPSFPIK